MPAPAQLLAELHREDSLGDSFQKGCRFSFSEFFRFYPFTSSFSFSFTFTLSLPLGFGLVSKKKNQWFSFLRFLPPSEKAAEAASGGNDPLPETACKNGLSLFLLGPFLHLKPSKKRIVYHKNQLFYRIDKTRYPISRKNIPRDEREHTYSKIKRPKGRTCYDQTV